MARSRTSSCIRSRKRWRTGANRFFNGAFLQIFCGLLYDGVRGTVFLPSAASARRVGRARQAPLLQGRVLAGFMPPDFRKLPKIELHCHLDASVRIATVAELGRQVGLTLPEPLA